MTQYKLNYTFDRPDKRDKPLRFSSPTVLEKLPNKTDLSAEMGKILEQGNLGSCTAHSVGYQLTFHTKKQGSEEYFSRLYIYFYGRVLAGYPVTKDTGLTMRQCMKGTANAMIPEKHWPYYVSKFAQRPPAEVSLVAEKQLTYEKVDQDLSSLRRCLAKAPISFGITLRSSFMSDEVRQSGIVPIPKQDELIEGGHAMLLVGHDIATKRFKVMNSWSQSWGEKGYCYIPQEMITDERMSGDFWTVKSLKRGALKSEPDSPIPQPAPSTSQIPTKIEPNVTEWVAKTMYASGQTVSYRGKLYRCIVTHESMILWTPDSNYVLWASAP